jgi:cbb3-type cytochrome oxidase subunit 1
VGTLLGEDIQFMGARFLKVAVVYFVIGVVFGMYMGIAQQFQMSSVHAHINLLGWVSLALAGVVYVLFPKAGASVLGKLHFWLHNIGLPLMVIGLYVEIAGLASVTALISIGGLVAIIGIILFAVNVFMHVKESNQVSLPSSKSTSL